MNRFLWSLILFGLAVPGARAADETAADEKTLKDAKVATDGPGLLAFFKGRTLTDDGRKNLAQRVKQLGDESFEVREKASEALVAAGKAAVPLLKKAVTDTDLEIARRAEDCLSRILMNSDAPVVAAAARLLAVRKPAGAAGALLDYLPAAEDEATAETLTEALAVLAAAAAKPDPALADALADKSPTCRAAAVVALLRCKAEFHAPVRKLLKDSDAKVRFAVASGLARAGDRDAVPVLIAFLAEGPPEFAWQTEDLLVRLAGEKSPAPLHGSDAAERRKVRDDWLAWWKVNEKKADLTLLGKAEKLRGLFMVVALQGGKNNTGRVYEFGADHKITWQIDDVQGPIDLQILPGGRVLLAEHNGGKVTERDRTGKVIWQHDLPSARACQRLPNGNTFMANFNELIEVDKTGKEVYRHKIAAGQLYDAKKLRNGNILYVTSGGEAIEVNVKGEQVRKVPAGDTSNWGSVELLANGHYLVCRCSKYEIVEIDAAGKEVWKAKAEWPTWATRLPNGHTLVACAHSGTLVEFDRAAKEVWQWKVEGRPCRLKRY
jgi:HEAT repeat protein